MHPLDTADRERTVARVDPSTASATDAAELSTPDTAFALTPPHNPGQMRVTKRNGGQEIVDVNKIVRAVTRSGEGLHAVDPLRVALKTIGGLYDGATTQELDQLSIRTAAALTAEEPEYGQLAARLLGAYIDKEVSGQEIQSFSQSIARGAELGILNARLRDFVAVNARKLNDAIDTLATRRFEYFGLRTVYDRYLLRHPQQRLVIETPQYFFMRIACALGGNEIGETRSCTACFRRWNTSPARPRCSTPAPRTSSCRRASCSTRRPIRWSRSTTSTPTWRSSASSPAASAWRTRACVRAAR